MIRQNQNSEIFSGGFQVRENRCKNFLVYQFDGKHFVFDFRTVTAFIRCLDMYIYIVRAVPESRNCRRGFSVIIGMDVSGCPGNVDRLLPAQMPIPLIRSTAEMTVASKPHFSLKEGSCGFLPGLHSQAEFAGRRPRARRASLIG